MENWDEAFEEFIDGEEGIELTVDIRTEETLRIAAEFLRNVEVMEETDPSFESLQHAVACGMQMILNWPVENTETHEHYCDDHAEFGASINRLRRLNGITKESR